MPWHDISDGGVLALVHQEDGRHLHSAPHRSPEWASERWWLRNSPPFCKSFFCKPLEIFRGDF